MSNDFSNIETALEWLTQADAVVIGAGSGLSSASGFDFYHNGSISEPQFTKFRKKYNFRSLWDGFYYLYSSYEDQWGFYSQIIQWMYDNTAAIPYQNLARLVRDKPHFVLTTNVDMQCSKVFSEKNIFPFQGDFRFFQCMQPCHDAIYSNLKEITAMTACLDSVSVPVKLVPRCPECGWVMVPWVRDNTFLEGSYWRECQQRYHLFLNTFKDCRILFLELGVGDMTPSIIKLPFWQMAESFPEARHINMNLAGKVPPEQLKGKTLTIAGDIAKTLEQIKERKYD